MTLNFSNLEPVRKPPERLGHPFLARKDSPGVRGVSDRLLEVPGELTPLLERIPVDIEAVARALGVVEITRQPLALDAMLLKKPDGFRLIINSDQTPKRQRFSCAHEVGHILIERAPTEAEGVKRWARSTSKPVVERACDRIAANLLMPESAFRKQANQWGWNVGSIPALAFVFDTSFTATSLRIMELAPFPCLMTRWNRPPSEARQARPAQRAQNWRCGRQQLWVLPKNGYNPYPAILQAFESGGPIQGVVEVSKLTGNQPPIQWFIEAKRFGGRQQPFVVALAHPLR